jgi:hypothetical protein
MTEPNTEPEGDQPDEGLPGTKIVWMPVRGGIWVQRFVRESQPDRRHKKRPLCECEINTSARRRPGTHHDAGCPRRQPW